MKINHVDNETVAREVTALIRQDWATNGGLSLRVCRSQDGSACCGAVVAADEQVVRLLSAVGSWFGWELTCEVNDQTLTIRQAVDLF